MPRPAKGSEEAKEFMRKLREMRGKKKMNGGMNGSEEKEEVKQEEVKEEEIKKLPKDVVKKILSIANEMKFADNEIKKLKRLLGRTLQDIQSEGGLESVLNELIRDTAVTRRILDLTASMTPQRLRDRQFIQRILGTGVKQELMKKAKAQGKLKKRPPITTLPIDVDDVPVIPLPMPAPKPRIRGRGVTKEQYDAVKKIMEVQASAPMSGIVNPMKV